MATGTNSYFDLILIQIDIRLVIMPGKQSVTCRFTPEEYSFYALGILDRPECNQIQDHLREGCETCRREMKEAFEFWYVFAALTERTQSVSTAQINPALRRKVIDLCRPHSFYEMVRCSKARQWMQIAAGIVLIAGAAKVSWGLGQARIKTRISTTEIKIQQQDAYFKMIEAENVALRSLVVAVRNAPPVFPGRDAIVSVQDPYLVRELQRSKQTQTSLSTALSEERIRTADLGTRLSQTTKLLAAATRAQEDADRRSRKMFDAAMVETQSGQKSVQAEIGIVNTRLQEFEEEVARDRLIINSQRKDINQYLQIVSFLQSTTVSLVHLKPAKDIHASGIALMADDSRLAFFPIDLPVRAEGRTFQLWIVRDKVPFTVNAGTFDHVSKNEPALRFTSYLSMSDAKELVVTEEPSGGSPRPTGRKLMEGLATRR